jgi:hypothetical protein
MHNQLNIAARRLRAEYVHPARPARIFRQRDTLLALHRR